MYTGMVSKFIGIKYSNCLKIPSATQLMTKCNTGPLHSVIQHNCLSIIFYISKNLLTPKKALTALAALYPQLVDNIDYISPRNKLP